jgi:hypothetical protein
MVEAGREAADGAAAEDARRGRDAFERRAWNDAWRALGAADRAGALAAGDLERLAVTAYLIGRDDDFLAILERAHHAHAAAGDTARALRCAFWLGMHLALRGETGHASGWLSRAGRLLEALADESAEHGYLMLPAAQRHLSGGDTDAAERLAGRRPRRAGAPSAGPLPAARRTSR